MDGTTQDPSLEARVGRLEGGMHEVKGTLWRLEPLIVAIHARVRGETEAKLEGVRGGLETGNEGLRGEVRAGLAVKPGYGALWSMAITPLALVVAAISAGAAYPPLLARSIHAGP